MDSMTSYWVVLREIVIARLGKVISLYSPDEELDRYTWGWDMEGRPIVALPEPANSHGSFSIMGQATP